MNEVDKNILYLIKLLKQQGKEKTIAAVYERVDILEQNVYKIRKGEKHFTVKHIKNFRKHYGVSLEWIFGYSEEVYINSAKTVQKNTENNLENPMKQ